MSRTVLMSNEKFKTFPMPWLNEKGHMFERFFNCKNKKLKDGSFTTGIVYRVDSSTGKLDGYFPVDFSKAESHVLNRDFSFEDADFKANNKKCWDMYEHIRVYVFEHDLTDEQKAEVCEFKHRFLLRFKGAEQDAYLKLGKMFWDWTDEVITDEVYNKWHESLG